MALCRPDHHYTSYTDATQPYFCTFRPCCSKDIIGPPPYHIANLDESTSVNENFLSRNTADGKTLATVAEILRADIAGIEEEVVSVAIRVRRTRPVVAERADTVQRATAVIVEARELKPERRAT